MTTCPTNDKDKCKACPAIACRQRMNWTLLEVSLKGNVVWTAELARR